MSMPETNGSTDQDHPRGSSSRSSTMPYAATRTPPPQQHSRVVATTANGTPPLPQHSRVVATATANGTAPPQHQHSRVATANGTPPPHSRVATANGNGRVVGCPGHAGVPDAVARDHEHATAAGQCCAVMTQTIAAPADAVWALVRRFDQPQRYKRFIRSCRLVAGDGVQVGSVRELEVITGLPAGSSRERLEIRDEQRRVIGFRILGGDHRLANYRSVTTVHEQAAQAQGGGGPPLTTVVESYVVDVPPGNTVEETHIFVGTIVGCNLQCLEDTVISQQHQEEEEEEEEMAVVPHNNHNYD